MSADIPILERGAARLPREVGDSGIAAFSLGVRVQQGGRRSLSWCLSNECARYESLDRRFKALAPHFAEHGFKVWNCTPDSGLTAFPHMDYAKAVERASAECSRPIDTRGWYAPMKGEVEKEKKP